MKQVRKIYRLTLREKRGAGDRGGRGTPAGTRGIERRIVWR